MIGNLLAEIPDFESLEAYVHSSKLKFREAVISYYRKLGEEKGFTVRENASIIRSGVNFGKLELLWLEPNIIFATEFGNIEEIYRHIWKMLEYGPKHAILILSSKAGCKADEVAKIIEKSSLVGDRKNIFTILDISEKKIISIS